MPLLWTSQTEVLWCELFVKPRGNVFRGQILAGPSGIGKSHIALLLALRCYALGMPVLYVPDAGELLDDCITYPLPLAIRWHIDVELLYSFAMLNVDVVPTALLSLVGAVLFPLSKSVRRLLNRHHAVVVLDEHGHAYNLLVKSVPRLSPTAIFPLLMPNSYLGNLHVRCVFAGSNQAQFEGELNGTYKPCLRFVVPFERRDAEAFVAELCRRAPSAGVLAQCERWANFVPGEMVKLLHAESVEKYVAQRRKEIADKLGRMADSLGSNTIQYFNMVRVLDDFFGASSMGMGIESYSFLDFGYVYRCSGIGATGGYGSVTAHPLCHPATLALMDLWRIASRPATKRLKQIVDESDGPGFEKLTWDVLLARGFLSGATLPCRRLGAGATTQQLQLNLTDYFVSQLICSTVTQEVVNREVAALSKRCSSLNMTLLYRCPKGSADVDFFLLHPDSTYDAIQVSMSTLTAHSPPGGAAACVNGIAPRYGIPATHFRYYIYITTQPEDHPRLAGTLSCTRIVDAAAWIGK